MDTGSTGNDKLDALNAKLGNGVLVEPTAIGGINGGRDTADNHGSDGDGDGSGAGDGGVRFNKDGSIRKKRGRKPGSGSAAGSAQTRKAKTPDGLSTVIYSLHMMAAKWTKVDELELDKQESDMLASAVDEVQRFYNVETSAEVLMWMGVIGTLITVYGPRVGAVVARKSREKENKPRPVTKPAQAQSAANVVPISDSIGSNGFDYPPPE